MTAPGGAFYPPWQIERMTLYGQCAHTREVNAHTREVNAHTREVNAHTREVNAKTISQGGTGRQTTSQGGTGGQTIGGQVTSQGGPTSPEGAILETS